jgi:transposase InsO family protein
MIYFWKHRSGHNWSLNEMYRSIGITKQGFHKQLIRHQYYHEEVLNMLEIIRQIRVDHPTMCCRDMYYKINPMFVGRDRFEAICKEHGFMVESGRNYRRTTDSSGVVRFDNLLKDKELTDINQAWSSDITYFEIDNAFYYITFVLDCYSRRILGHQVSSRLLTEQTSLPALKKAIKVRGNKLPEGIIFHSDGGGQYYDQEFIRLTERYKFKNSMCEYAYENGKSERLNGVIKNNYLKHWPIEDLGQLIEAVDRAVDLYNSDKPHSSLQRSTPIAFEAKRSKLAMLNKSSIPDYVE